MGAHAKTRICPRGQAATLACLWEASAAKAGNVHPGADFDDVTFHDFELSAVVIGPILERTPEVGVGQTVLDAVLATRERVGTNTNLGTLLLLAPLTAVPDGLPLRSGVKSVLAQLTFDDTRFVYLAIRASAAGGLGTAREADVFHEAPPNLHLVDAMRLATDVDLVARQYTNNFADVFSGTAEWIAEGLSRKWRLDVAIVHAHLRQIARHGDSLITRKCGQPASDEARDRAKWALAAGLPGDDTYERALGQFDRWLREDGHRRNPGTSADLIAAGLFVLLREGRVELPLIPEPHAAGLPLAGG
jgi:triphosphoribosyl-dephospho-CoA synthase